MADEMLNEALTAGLRSALESRKETIEGFSARAGIAPRTLHRRLSGEVAWNTDDVAVVCTALGIGPLALLEAGRAALDEVA